MELSCVLFPRGGPTAMGLSGARSANELALSFGNAWEPASVGRLLHDLRSNAAAPPAQRTIGRRLLGLGAPGLQNISPGQGALGGAALNIVCNLGRAGNRKITHQTNRYALPE